ncbi:hypothetical protein [Neisseria sp. P0019.S002]|uniref:hypothetical protein n=1 Tax=Neisseria sp. P0019.S002 TaxID=3436798 RepID=UPI003F7F3D00
MALLLARIWACAVKTASISCSVIFCSLFGFSGGCRLKVLGCGRLEARPRFP